MNASMTVDVDIVPFYGVLAQVKPAIVSRLPEKILAELLRRRILTLDGISAEQKTIGACIAALEADPAAIDAVPDELKADAIAGAAEAERRAFIAAANALIPPAQMAASLAARGAEIVPFAA